MYEHNALGFWSGLALCLTKVRSSRARCPATALIYIKVVQVMVKKKISTSKTWVGVSSNRPGLVTPHPCTNKFLLF